MERKLSCEAAILGAGLLLVCGTAPGAESASSYPSRPVRIIIPFSPGGGADNLARTLQPGLSSALGQPLVLDNRPGASSIIGTELAAHSAPDGYTMVLITTTYTVTPALVKKLPYDPVSDLAGASLAVTQPNVLVVHPSVPAKSVKDLVALAKAKPAALTYASGGSGSAPHLGGELLQMVAGIKLTHVPYKGSGPGVIAVLGNQVTMMFVGPLAIETHVASGKLRALATADRKRSAVLPEVPTVAEAGYAGVESGTWYGFAAPARTPQPVLAAFHAAVLKAMAVPEMKSRLLAQGVEIVGNGPREFDRTIREEIAKWDKVVKAAGISAE
jgi:tripartite-type tricarboxylate transporter receptor subunit TctC